MFDNESINKLVFSSAEDALTNLAMPDEALKLLLNIKQADEKDKENSNKLVFSNPDEALNNSAIPDEALKLLMNIQQADKVVENKNVQKAKKEETPDASNLISKMSFNPETGFTFDPSILAKLSLNSEPAQNTNITPQEEVEIKPKEKINISQTTEYTKEEASALVRSFNISEEGIFLGIIIGSTQKEAVIEIMGKHSDVKFDNSTTENILEFDDLSITAYFDDENIVNQLEFGKKFRGNTSKGLRIGDNLEKAIELYGNPMMKSPKGAVWKGLKVFFTDGEITSIKIQKA